jgi:glycosyltransferase involved in cell wall biosynthesis
MKQRIFYAAGPGNVIQAHKYWVRGQHDPSEVSITFSSQLEEFCNDIHANAYIISYHSQVALYKDGPFVLEHRPKPMPGGSGITYHLAEIVYGLGLLTTAIRFRANVAVLDSGSSHYFVLALFRLAGVKIVTVLHNTLWPAGFPSTRLIDRVIAKLNSLYFQSASGVTIGVSPECVRQMERLTKGRHNPIYQIRAQFIPEYFRAIPRAPSHSTQPFRIMYIGRIVRMKGVFDILEMAQKIETRTPGRVRWEVCGSGPDLDELRRQQIRMGLEDIVTIHGWTSLSDLRDVYARNHISIVPTRSNYSEGMAMTAVEAILAGRPVITNPVVPALEVLKPACIEAQTNDVDSYVSAILKLIDDSVQYRGLCDSCPALGHQFYDRQRGLTAILKKAMKNIGCG